MHAENRLFRSLRLNRHDRRCCRCNSLPVDDLGQMSNVTRFGERTQRQGLTELLLHLGHQSECENRMSAEIEEAVFNSDRTNIEDFFPDRNEPKLDRRAWRDELALDFELLGPHRCEG